MWDNSNRVLYKTEDSVAHSIDVIFIYCRLHGCGDIWLRQSADSVAGFAERSFLPTANGLESSN
jgi:hypothetical protein